MNFFIEDVGSTNKGAYLMYLAIEEKIKAQFKNSKIIVEDRRFSKLEEAEHNLYKFVHFQRFKIKIHNFIDSTQLAKYNLIKFNEVDLVLNAGGYANGDFWYELFGKNIFIKKLETYKQLKKLGIPIVLLPQAFDAFTSNFIKNYIVEIHDLVDLIYARDQISLYNLQSVLGKSKKIKLSPDFTNLIEVNHSNMVNEKYVTIIPNVKMIQAGVISRMDYIDILRTMINIVYSNDFKVVLLNHEGELDEKLILEVQNKVEFDCTILTNLDALEIKSIIKDSKLVITGRFHGLVSALSQNVPVLATSWSHKYKELLADYKAEAQLLDVNNKTELINKLEKNLQNKYLKNLKSSLEGSSKFQKSKAEIMWKEIFEKIEKLN